MTLTSQGTQSHSVFPALEMASQKVHSTLLRDTLRAPWKHKGKSQDKTKVLGRDAVATDLNHAQPISALPILTLLRLRFLLSLLCFSWAAATAPSTEGELGEARLDIS